MRERESEPRKGEIFFDGAIPWDKARWVVQKKVKKFGKIIPQPHNILSTPLKPFARKTKKIQKTSAQKKMSRIPSGGRSRGGQLR